jgi:hypothetical protein
MNKSNKNKHMKSITTTGELQAAIKELELQQAGELTLLKEQYHETKEGFKLINIIKGTFKDAAASPGIKKDAINAAIGFTTGIVARKLMVGKTINPFKKLLGVAVEMAVASKAVKNAEGIKSIGSVLFNTIFRKKEEKDKS